jgi:hypothetical protein
MSSTEATTDEGRTTRATGTGAAVTSAPGTGETEELGGRRMDVTDTEGRDIRATDVSDTEQSGSSSAAERLGGPTERERRQARPSSAEVGADDQVTAAGRERATLIAPERAEGYNSRWNELKSEFVDEPRRAVRGANELVGQVLDEVEELFRRQRSELEQGLDSEQTSTEDLRLALGRYRSFFDRLLSF